MKIFSFISFRTCLQPTVHLGQVCVLAGKGERGGSGGVRGGELTGLSVSVQQGRRGRHSSRGVGCFLCKVFRGRTK